MRTFFLSSLAMMTLATAVVAQDSSPGEAAESASAPAFLDLASAIYVVPDLSAATEWYSIALGLEPYFEEPFYVAYRIGGQELGLVPAEGGDAVGPGGSIAYWRVADANSSLARLLSLGAAEQYPVTDVGGGVLVASVTDPYGNIIGIIELPAQGQ